MTKRRLPSPAISDPQLVALVTDRRLLLRQLSEVMARKGPSTPNRNAVNRERAERRRELRDAIRRNEHLAAVRLSELLPRPEDPDNA